MDVSLETALHLPYVQTHEQPQPHQMLQAMKIQEDILQRLLCFLFLFESVCLVHFFQSFQMDL